MTTFTAFYFPRGGSPASEKVEAETLMEAKDLALPLFRKRFPRRKINSWDVSIERADDFRSR